MAGAHGAAVLKLTPELSDHAQERGRRRYASLNLPQLSPVVLQKAQTGDIETGFRDLDSGASQEHYVEAITPEGKSPCPMV